MKLLDQDIPGEILANPGSLAAVPSRDRHPIAIFLWAAAAAFGTYFCMYGVRVPFKVSTYSDVPLVFGAIDFKTAAVIAQVLGYTISKFIGIRVISELNPTRRAAVLLGLVLAAELALVGFGAAPIALKPFMLLLNGLPLGMVFGLVMGFLEGRRQSEAMLAILCCSFITADGVTKGVGRWIMDQHISQFWMPALAGLIFFVPLAGFVWALKHIPKPDHHDIAARSERQSIGKEDRWALFRKYSLGLTMVMIGYLLLTILRSLRGDFAAEIWKALGVTTVPSTFASTETVIGIVATLIFGLLILIRNNRSAFKASIGIAIAGFALGMVALVGLHGEWIAPFPFMVLLGLGLYLPYMAVHTTLFERLLAMSRDKGNIGYLMYLVDSFGYLGYVALIVSKGYLSRGAILPLFLTTSWLTMAGGIAAFIVGGLYFLSHASVKHR